jgi:kinesin family protein 12
VTTPSNNNDKKQQQQQQQQKRKDSAHQTKKKQFTYDYIMTENTSQEHVFEKSGVRDMIDSAIDGYTTTVFAYGQTGSGKTFTICGEGNNTIILIIIINNNTSIETNNQLHGILPRSADYLFNRIQYIIEQEHQNRNNSSTTSINIRASYLEIWNEQINDLLNLNSVNLPVRWSNIDGFFVENLFVVQCTDAEDFMAVVTEGISNRRVAAHDMNKDSSRSHSIFTVYFDISIKQKNDDTLPAINKNGKIHFVDLAGSERLKESHSSGGTAVETGHINKSLFTLGKVINTLSDPKKMQQQGVYVPYRDSKLTKLLMDSIGGTSKTLMIACITPSSMFADETLNTLKYANRVKNIKNKPIVHMDPHDKIVYELREQIKKLSNELFEAKTTSDHHQQHQQQHQPFRSEQ